MLLSRRFAPPQGPQDEPPRLTGREARDPGETLRTGVA